MGLCPENLSFHPTSASLVQPIIEAGKPVFVDKFLAPSIADAQNLHQAPFLEVLVLVAGWRKDFDTHGVFERQRAVLHVGIQNV